MNKVAVLVGIIVSLVALLIIFLAYLIKYKKQVNLISGYDEQTCRDKDGLANLVGGTLLITGVIAFCLGVLVTIVPAGIHFIMIMYAITIITGVMITAVKGKKFKL